MNWKAVLLAALALASCGADLRSRELAGLDLNDPAVVEEIREGLNGEERSAFSTYLVLHWPGSKKYCGEALVDRNGQLPVTVGGAIDLTRQREEDLRLARIEAARPRTAAEILEQQRLAIVAKQDALLSRQSLLMAEHGPEAETRHEWADIQKGLEQARAELVALDESPPETLTR